MADIFHRVGIKAPVARAYEAVATAKGVAGWWTEDVSGKSDVGQRLKFEFRSLKGELIGGMEMTVTALEKDKRVQWNVVAGPPEWIGTDIIFDLKQEGDTTILLFGHNNWKKPVEFMAHCSMKWATFLLSLRSLVETGKGQPSPHDLKIDNWN